MKLSLTLIALLSLFSTANLEAQPPAVNTSAMQKIKFLYGRWQGEGQYFFPGAPKQRVLVKEHVSPKLDGQVVLLEGLGTIDNPAGGEPITVHDALGVLSWDATRKVYEMRAFRQGEAVDSDVEVGDRRLVWGFSDPRGAELRFTLTIDEEGRWTERGEMKQGESGWQPFFEMKLERVGDA